MYDIMTFGSATVDLFVHSDPDSEVITTGKKKEKLLSFPLGGKILINEMIFETGGGGTNTAVALSRLGLKVAFLGKVGDDDNGKKILDTLERENVVFLGKVEHGGKSGFSVILDSVRDDRTIFTYKGVNDHLHFSEIEKSKLAASWFYFSSMVGDSYKALEDLADFAKKHKIKVMFNPSAYLAKKGARFLKKVIDACEIIIMNKEEAEMITKKSSIDKCLKELQKSVPLVIITDGKNGAFAYDGKIKYSIAARKIEVVETTGAGDAFASSFLAGLILKKNMEFALQLALANSESVIQNTGAKKNLLSLSKAVEVIREHPAKVKQEKL